MIAPLAAVLGAAAVFSARWNWWRPKTKGLAALMYHKIGDYPKGSQLQKLWVTRADFKKQLQYLKDHGYTPVHFIDLKRAEEKTSALPDNPVLITFDDGYANNYETAFPLLKEMNMKGNIFLVYETMDRHNSWHNPATEPWLNMLTWAQIEEMQNSGFIEFGSHTMKHRCLTKISVDDARWELNESKKRLEEKLGREMVGFAYPYGAGAYDQTVRRLAREAGYRYDFGVKQGISPWPWNPDSGPLKRLLIRGDDTMLDFHINMTRGRSRF